MANQLDYCVGCNCYARFSSESNPTFFSNVVGAEDMLLCQDCYKYEQTITDEQGLDSPMLLERYKKNIAKWSKE